MSHIWMSHVTPMNESCHTYEWIMSHLWMRSCHTYAWVLAHIWMRHVADVSDSCHTCAWSCAFAECLGETQGGFIVIWGETFLGLFCKRDQIILGCHNVSQRVTTCRLNRQFKGSFAKETKLFRALLQKRRNHLGMSQHAAPNASGGSCECVCVCVSVCVCVWGVCVCVCVTRRIMIPRLMMLWNRSMPNGIYISEIHSACIVCCSDHCSILMLMMLPYRMLNGMDTSPQLSVLRWLLQWLWHWLLQWLLQRLLQWLLQCALWHRSMPHDIYIFEVQCCLKSSLST